VCKKSRAGDRRNSFCLWQELSLKQPPFFHRVSADMLLLCFDICQNTSLFLSYLCIDYVVTA
jgi:hypothetical protein